MSEKLKPPSKEDLIEKQQKLIEKKDKMLDAHISVDPAAIERLDKMIADLGNQIDCFDNK